MISARGQVSLVAQTLPDRPLVLKDRRAFLMGRKGYGAMSLIRAPYSPNFVRTFGKKQAHRFVCNRCRNKFTAGERGKQTTFGAYKHYPKCPDLPTGVSSKDGDRNR